MSAFAIPRSLRTRPGGTPSGEARNARNDDAGSSKRFERARGPTKPHGKALDADLDGEAALDELHVERVARDARAELKLRHARLPRQYVLLSMSLVLIGTTKESVGVESFLQRVVARSGERVVSSPRIGLETEIIRTG